MAARIIQICGGLSDRDIEAQVLDAMALEREHGMTNKAQTAALDNKARDAQVYDPQLLRPPGPLRIRHQVSASG